MKQETINALVRQMEENGVETVRLQFTDITGTLKSIAVTPAKFARLREEPFFVDGSFLAGRDGEDGVELMLKPDPSTFTILPWKSQPGNVARLLCSLYQEDGTPFAEDSREVLRQAERRAAANGYELSVRPECEFFLFHSDDDGRPTVVTHERAGYLDAHPIDLGENARRDMVRTLEEMGVEVEASRHEISPGQHGIDLKPMGLMEAADGIVTFRSAVRSVAKRHGLHATFMPKPLGDAEGSGVHLHFTLCKDGKNVFAGEEKGSFSEEAAWFAGGLLTHMKAMAAVSNPLVNSYKRLVSGTKAPTELCWSSRRENSLLRIPPVRGTRTRVEFRGADGSANPYLLLALCLETGLDGIAQRIEIREGESLGRLPENLGTAIACFREDAFVKKILGEPLWRRYGACRQEEWLDYERQVTSWELREYLYRY